MGVHLQATEAKHELLTIAMKNTESVSKYYHRIFKLWTKAQTPTADKIVKFTRSLKPGISITLLRRKFTDIKAVLNEARAIKDAWKEITYTFPRQDNRQFSSSPFTQGSNSCGSAAANGSSVTANRGLEGKNRKPIATKLAGWSGAWYDPDPKPKKLENDNRIRLSCQGRCWICRGLGHCESNNCCSEFKKQLNLNTTIREADSESEKE